MGWDVHYLEGSNVPLINSSYLNREDRSVMILNPYAKTVCGLAQFAPILLAHPSVMTKFMISNADGKIYPLDRRYSKDIILSDHEASQAVILDEILKDAGIDFGENLSTNMKA